METIITLLLILIPLVFKAIGKKLEDAGKVQTGQSDTEDQKEDWAETLRRHLEAQTVLADKPVELERQEVKAEPVKVQTKNTGFKPVQRQSVMSSVSVHDAPVKKEKIDPRKLVVYSEIMKPKYTEFN